MAEPRKPEAAYDAQKVMKKIMKYVIKTAIKDIKNTDTFFKLPSFLPKAYTRIIKRPIDISEIMFNVEDEQYKNVDELEDDLMLLCENAQQYNAKKSAGYKDAIRLEYIFFEARKKYDRKISQKSRNNLMQKECFDIQLRVKVEKLSERRIKKYLKIKPSSTAFKVVGQSSSSNTSTNVRTKVEKPKYYDIDPSNLYDGKRIRSTSDQKKTNATTVKPKVEKPKYYDIDESNLHEGKRIRSSSDLNKTVKRKKSGHQDHQPDKKRPKHSHEEIPHTKTNADHRSPSPIVTTSSLFDALNNEIIDLTQNDTSVSIPEVKKSRENKGKSKNGSDTRDKKKETMKTYTKDDDKNRKKHKKSKHKHEIRERNDEKSSKRPDDRHQKKEKKKKSHKEKRDDKKIRETKPKSELHGQSSSSAAIQDKTSIKARNRPKILTDCDIFGGMPSDKKIRETKKPAFSQKGNSGVSTIADDKSIESKLDVMFNDQAIPQIQKSAEKIRVRFNDQLEIVQYDEDETVTSFQEYLQNSPNIATTSTQSVSRNFVSSDNENSNMSATSKLAAKKDILNEAAIYQSISRKNVAKLVAEDILDKAICKAIPYEKRWYCPLCARFDATDGVLNEQEVRSHIVRKHAEGILDIDPTKFQSERHKYICQIPNCSETFSKDQDLIYHIGETHHILHESIFNGIHFPKNKYAKKLEMTDYLPKPYNRDGNEIRFKCLRCEHPGFSKKYEMLNHIAWEHYREYLIPMGYLEFSYTNFGGDLYTCQQKNCQNTFNTYSALVWHENMEHAALETYIGKIIGPNDLFARIS